MTDQPTPDQIEAFLDDLARLSLRHGLVVEHAGDRVAIRASDWRFDGYSYSHQYGEKFADLFSDMQLEPNLREPEEGYGIDSIDLAQLSNHERLEILGNRSPDLDQMMREAFMEGAQAGGDAFGRQWPVSQEEIERECGSGATEYAAKIMGGQS